MVALHSLSPAQITELLNTNARSRTPVRAWFSREKGWQDSKTPTGSISGSFRGKAGKPRKYLVDYDSDVLAYKV